MNFAAALLAGGRSTRMGQDKAWLLWQGEPLAKRQLRVLAEIGAEVLMVSCREEQVGGDAEPTALTPSPLPQAVEGGHGGSRSKLDVEMSVPTQRPNLSVCASTPPSKIDDGVSASMGRTTSSFASGDGASPACSPSTPGRGEGVRGEIVAAATSLFDHAHYIVFDPLNTDEGPLGGIVRCLQTTDLPLLVLAVDMPHVTSAFLRERLIEPFAEQSGKVIRLKPKPHGPQGLVFRGAHGFEPLAALYTPAMLPMLEAALQSGRLGLQSLIADAVELGLMKIIDMQPADGPFFRNVNTPADLAEDKFTAAVQMIRVQADGTATSTDDLTAREEPLEIRVQGRNVAVVMRTPGHDRELAAGFLLSEGVVQCRDQILDIIKCPGTGRSKGNIVDVLVGDAQVDWGSLTRHVFSASSCGLCGKTSIDSVFQRFAPVTADVKASPELLWSLADKVRAAQATFTKTGGLHACAIFDLEGNLIVLREDVGRHNALDKILGYALLHDLLPFDQQLLFLSGRVSFEMMQKALAAGVPIISAISAPSSLAVQFAEESNQTLVGFLRERSLNIYTHGHRIEPMTNDD